jgi:hypothetical protein
MATVLSPQEEAKRQSLSSKRKQFVDSLIQHGDFSSAKEVLGPDFDCKDPKTQKTKIRLDGHPSSSSFDVKALKRWGRSFCRKHGLNF